MNESKVAQNTDRELWREEQKEFGCTPLSIHVTQGGGVGINVEGSVFVMTLAAWHGLAFALEDAECLARVAHARNCLCGRPLSHEQEIQDALALALRR